MPIYAYICLKCKTEFELMRPFSLSEAPVACPVCRGETQKQLTNFASKTGSYLQSPTAVFKDQGKKK